MIRFKIRAKKLQKGFLTNCEKGLWLGIKIQPIISVSHHNLLELKVLDQFLNPKFTIFYQIYPGKPFFVFPRNKNMDSKTLLEALGNQLMGQNWFFWQEGSPGESVKKEFWRTVVVKNFQIRKSITHCCFPTQHRNFEPKLHITFYISHCDLTYYSKWI